MININIYRVLTIIFSPIIDLYLFVRLLKGKEDKKRFLERFGYTKIARPKGKILWFHAASVGEANSVLPVIKEFLSKENNKNITILFTSGTVTSAKSISQKIQEYNVIHQFVPIDKYFVVKRFLKHWKPDLFFTVESEFWPNLITLTHKINCPIIIINGKLSEKSLRNWKNKPVLKEQVFSCIDICFPQTTEDERRFLELGIQNMNYLGNLKFDVPVLKSDDIKVNKLKENLKIKKQIWAVASTHEKEERIIAQIHQKLKTKYPDLLTVIILRHPNRQKEVTNMLTKKYSLNVVVRTKNKKIKPDTDIYLCDTIGEMGTLYKTFDIVMMAGSLVDNIGGHTPVEPAKLYCAILTGPYVFNNKTLFTELYKNDACIMVEDKGHIVDNTVKEVSNLFDNPQRVQELKQNAYRVSMQTKNITKQIVSVIEREFKDVLK